MKQVEEAPQMDWQQVILNGGPPCFALLDDEEGWYCGRAQRWDGHDGEHEFVSLDDLIKAGRIKALEEAARIAESFYKPLQYRVNPLDVADSIRALVSSTPASAAPID